MSCTIYDRTMYRGISYTFNVECRTDGVAASMTGKTLKARFMLEGSTTPDFTRSSATSAEFSWTDQSAGTGKWLWPSDETIAYGNYLVEFYDEDSSSPVVRHTYGTAHYRFREPEEGTF